MDGRINKGYRVLSHAGAYLKRSRKLRISFNSFFKDTFFIVIGIFSAAFGLESFLLPNRFIDGGATGISLLATEITILPLYLLIIVVNIPFLILGYKVIGKTFAIKASLAILGLALVLATMHFPEITQDKLLVAVFGGFFLGAGIGLSIRGGGVLDGTEVLAIFLSRKMGTTIGDIIILINIVIFLAAAYLLSIETALYSMLTYLSASKTLDFVVDGIEEYTGVTIISLKSEAMRIMITEKLGRGLTIYRAKGGYGKNGIHNDYDVIYTVITRLEIRKLNIEISKIDPNAFVVMNSINDTRGGMIKKRHL
ncbi:YitT family protein [Sediminicola sp. YIK13]|uniref:YitT family protein n=1 Tax=Sediminicola sp. YIK13 TaxID=1453352 RepID=UPI0007835940|nr:YitT family protein [Sediminicola sp. YIK13]